MIQPKGYIIAPGCSVPLHTPFRKLSEAYMEVTKECAEYPYDPTHFD